MLNKDQVIMLLNAGWNLRDHFQWYPEHQACPKDKEIEAIADSIILYGHIPATVDEDVNRNE